MLRTLLFLYACLCVPAASAQTPSPEQLDFFERRVRPVLAEHCFSCHGPKKQMSGLRLDSRAALLEGGDNGPALAPGHPEKSPLIAAIGYAEKRKMPPKAKLPAAAIADLSAWVKMGAPWPVEKKVEVAKDESWKKHWAFQPVRKPPMPTVKDGAWGKTSVDAFILAKLEEKGLTPSPPAEKRVLIRRLYFDLIGLPPTPEEVGAFEADTAPDAYAKLVDKLLASPHYGERWGRHWLDVARYADTKGYVFFEQAEFPWAYTYRDYVIRSFNEDKPYDRFVLEQLAADRLGLGPDQRPLTGLGFLTIGGRFMNNQHDILDDRIDVVTRGLMGLTVTCGRCHDHKFDPISSKDYYGLYGVFASCAEPTVPPLFEPEPKTEEYVKFDKKLKELEGKLTEFVKQKHEELVSGARKRVAEYLVAAHALRDAPSTEDFMLIADGKDLNPTMIVRWQKYLERRAKKADPVFAPWHALAALPEKESAAKWAPTLEAALKDKSVNRLVREALEKQRPKDMAKLAEAYSTLLTAIDKKWQEAAKRGAGKLADPAEEELRLVFYAPNAAANVAFLPYGDLSLLPDRASQAILQKLRGELEKWRATGPGAPARANVLEDLPEPFVSRVFLRGNPNNLGEPAPRQFVSFLKTPDARPFEKGSGRLDLARAIIDPKNPLTARVLVNRVWLHHFGVGLVRTPSDFGLRSDPPSHPELLDHLATSFVENGWSIKKLHRLILLSATYRQQSKDRPEAKKVDPENVLLWKMNRRRLDFEAMRDALLAVSGRLDAKIGGPSVKDVLSPGNRRRTLYGFLDRLNVPSVYRTFDFPSPDASSPGRDVTTVAPQALFFMNNPFVRENAKGLLARKEVAAEKETAAKVARLYRLLYGRAPGKRETALAREFLGTTPAAGVWEEYAQALLLANEFVFVD
ncbi:MAG: PSD1 and planctomycete cytochrome C domain-containing protein [Gemmataceae bacterium]